MNKLKIIMLIAFLSFALTACNTVNPSDTQNTLNPQYTPPSATKPDNFDFDYTISDKNKDDSFSESNSTVITFSREEIKINGRNAVVNGNIVTISAGGTYILSGTSDNASVNISAAKTDKVQLVLRNVNLSCENGAAIYVDCADKVTLTLEQGTNNTISGGKEPIDEKIDAAIFSREDITFNGNGTLTVNGNYKHGIVSKDDLIIAGGTINVYSVNTGISGKDCVKICNATINVNAGTDGIQSDNAEDVTKGFVYIESGSITIQAKKDGIQAENAINTVGGNIVICTNSGSSYAPQHSGGFDRNPWFGGSSSDKENTASAKGLKSGSNITISGGTLDIDSYDDCIHSNGDISITGGTLKLKSGDDGIHADTSITVKGGNITIDKSYEGIEAKCIDISDGEITVNSSDDGLNATDGSNTFGGRPGFGSSSNSDCKIVITGGYIFINADGDGVDSNGSISISGGTIIVCGPSDNANSAIDYETSAAICGGTIVAVGSAGMAVNFTSAQNQACMLVSLNTQAAGTAFAVCNENGDTIVAFTPPKAYQCIIVSTPSIQKGDKYNILTNVEINNADKFGFATECDTSSGNILYSITMNSEIQSTQNNQAPGGKFPGGQFPGGQLPPR